MIVRFHKSYEGDTEEIGAVNGDGEVISGDGDRLEGMGAPDAVKNMDEDGLLRRFNGPTVMASIEDESAVTKAWVPYQGPQGGDGWQNTDTGEVVYQDGPPGEIADVSEMTIEQLGEALASMLGEESAQQVFDAASDRSDIETYLESEIEGAYGDVSEEETGKPPVEIAQYDVDWGLTNESSYVYGGPDDSGYAVLDKSQRDAFKEQLRGEHGSDAVNSLDRWRDSWKTSSYSDIAQVREKAFMEAAEVDGQPRNHSLESDEEPSREAVAAANDVKHASQHFVEEHYADEDGMVEVHRGLGERSGDELKEAVFAQIAADADAPDTYEFEFNPMTNYSVDRGVASSWGRETATITEERFYKDTLAATDLVMEDGQEGEVSMTGNETEVPAENIMVNDEWSPAEVLADDPDMDALSDALDTADQMVDDIYRKRDWPEETLDGIIALSEKIKAETPDDHMVREAAKDDVAESAGESAEMFHNMAEDAMVDAIGEGQDAHPGVFDGIIGRDDQRNADNFVDNLTEVLPEEQAVAVLEEITGERHYVLNGGEVWSKADDVSERAEGWNDEDSKLEDGEVDIIDASTDPDSVDWIARSRDEREKEDDDEGATRPSEKAWMPYEGTQGGEGWQDTDSGRVVYDDEPPGSMAGPDDISPGDMVKGLNVLLPDAERARAMRKIAGGDYDDDDIEALYVNALDSVGLADGEETETMGETDAGPGVEVGDDVQIDGQPGVVKDVMTMGGGKYVLAAGEDGETLSARVGPSDRIEAPEGSDMDLVDAENVVEGDRVEIDGEEGEVVQATDMGGGRYIVAETGDGDMISERVGADESIPATGNEGPWTGPRNEGTADLDTDALLESVEEYVTPEDMNDYRAYVDQGHPEWVLDDIPNRTEERVEKDAKRPDRFEDNHAPDHLDPSRAEDIDDLSDTGEHKGVTAAAMDVAEMPDGSELYVTHVSPELKGEGVFYENAASPDDAAIATSAADALEALGVPAPDHHYEHNRFFSVEDSGPVLRDFDRLSPSHDVDKDQAKRTMAAQMIIGNRDPHDGNVAIMNADDPDKEDKLVAFDLDLSARDASAWLDHRGNPKGALYKAIKSYRKAVGHSNINRDDAKEELLQEIKTMANNADVDEVTSEVEDEGLEEAIRQNIEFWKDASV